MSGLSSAPYDLGRSTGVCAVTGEALTPGTEAVAVLVEREQDDQLERLDYSAEAWDRGERPARLFCFWRRRIPSPNERPKPFIDDDELVALFDQLQDAEQDRQIAFRFILSLILIRKRLLRHVGSKTDAEGRAVSLLKRKGAAPDDGPIAVIDPGMDESAIASATELLGQALRGDG